MCHHELWPTSVNHRLWIEDCVLFMWGKIMTPMYRLWLHGVYERCGPRCPLSPKRLLRPDTGVKMDLNGSHFRYWLECAMIVIEPPIFILSTNKMLYRTLNVLFCLFCDTMYTYVFVIWHKNRKKRVWTHAFCRSWSPELRKQTQGIPTSTDAESGRDSIFSTNSLIFMTTEPHCRGFRSRFSM